MDHRWLLGEVGAREPLAICDARPAAHTEVIALPLPPHPVVGPPYQIRVWDGSTIEVGGVVG